MSEFIPDPGKPLLIVVGGVLVDLLGGKYRVETVTVDYFEVRCFEPALKLPEWLVRPGVIRYRWDEPCPLRTAS